MESTYCVNDLIHGLSAEKKANLINQCLISLHEINFKIISLTFDGTATNFTAFKTLTSLL